MKNFLDNINLDKLINLPFGDIYPLTDELSKQILSCLNADEYRISLQDIQIDGRIDDFYIIIIKTEKAIRLPMIENIISKLSIMNITNIIFIASSFSSKCFDYAIKNNIFLISIDTLMTEEFKPTYMKRLGRKFANSENGHNMSVSVRVPIEGYPELGYPGPISGTDLRELLDLLLVPKNSANSISVEATKIFYKTFQDLVEVINSGKNITASKWDDIMNKYNVYDFVENEENSKYIDEVTK